MLVRENLDKRLPNEKIAIDAEYKRVEREKKRVGRPRFFWLRTTMSRSDKLRRKQKGDTKQEFDIRIKEHREYVAEAAISREYPFHHKTKRRRKLQSEMKTKGSSAKKQKY